LTTGFWPTYTAVDTVITSEMSASLRVFEEFYSKRTQHRRLQWIHSLGTATVSARFTSAGQERKYDLVMNTYQALILMLFNENQQLSVEQIASSLKLEEGFAKKLCATFVLSKFKVLTRVSGDVNMGGASSSSAEAVGGIGSGPIESSDILAINESFSVPHRKVKIPPPTAGTEETHNKGKVEEDRSFSIEAAIVRVMKTRKILQHQQLIAEVVSQLTLFKPNPKVIKQRIENLIEREFLERDQDNQNIYKYLA
jgi:cullin 1